jgi:4-hydroxybenzoate polyprenyltransferase
MVLYSIRLKKIPVVDLFCISCGFLIRLQSGGTIFYVEISEWLFLSVFFLSLFLSSGKRLSEQSLLGIDAAEHRASLCGYSVGTLDAMLHITGATVLVTYAMYTVVHPKLVYTVPLCCFGIFRYILRIKSGNSGDPTESLLNDIPLLLVSILWALLVGWSIYL